MNALTVETRGPVLLATINRIDAHNALNAEVLDGLAEAVDRAESDPNVRALVITGAGEKAFCAGADLKEVSTLDADAAQVKMRRGQSIMAAIENAEVPIIAAVNGLALGGGFELALACHFTVLSERASLGLPEVGLGLIPGYGGTQRLPRAVGDATALHLILTGETLKAQRAFELGITPVPPTAPEEVVDTALSIADRIAAQGPNAVRSVLRAVRADRAISPAALATETGLISLAIVGDESSEGIAAFLEKRAPNFGAASAKSDD
ncbi:enoyl-CoA hydratase/isomerase family protein [Brevibacterium linens]|uniref:enoyl-CoA hydratase n=1 Tax=Brevibacterium linens TaxID=1703 RepID=A0A144ME65_BRELN|nr:enoyl-CoA hydratase-related protein [Brevibacterium linens]AMT92938.1 crotonase [Brevibacterium linens]